eukprot:TRINITY_DN2111_c0_g3_i1.p1 TRINITY_DN2111_c0_g3~~TRINITY_DN2111_c0_g3_i1.p1  ORF type:complete len:415 (-),score=86.60 TRINITY_DN2111_c0_g3_i1:25-1269(-)
MMGTVHRAMKYPISRLSSSLTPTSIYVHYPYCSMICSYCAFNKYHQNNTLDSSRLTYAYISELSNFKQMCDTSLGHRIINTIYFGGGTPSLADPGIFDGILRYIRTNFEVTPDCEITIECNPNDIQNIKSFKEMGINRASLGIQSFVDSDLRFLGRKHSSSDAYQSLELVAKYFDKVSFDLIYARHANQSPDKWKKELSKALELCVGPVNHISLYSLVMEPTTPLGKKVELGLIKLPNIDDEADMFDISSTIAESFGLTHYEISNYARQGNESQHSLCGWAGHDYFGIGPGAASRITDIGGAKRQALIGINNPTKWAAACEKIGHGLHLSECKILTDHERIQECMLMGLRTIFGVSENTFLKSSGGKTLKQGLIWEEVERLRDAGLLYVSSDCCWIGPTPKGMSLLDFVLRSIC